jgi:hypothetical protein
MVHPAVYADGKIPVRNQRVNPWAYLTQYGYGIYTASKIESLFAVDQKLDFVTKGLSTKLTFSFDNYSSSSLSRTKSPSYYLPATSRDDEGDLILTLMSSGSEFLNYSAGSSYGNNQTYLEWVINYDRTFNNDHNVTGLLLYNQRSYDDGGIQPYRNQGIAGRLLIRIKANMLVSLISDTMVLKFCQRETVWFFPVGSIRLVGLRREFLGKDETYS